MITGIDIDHAARVLIDEHGAGALMEAMNRLEQYLALGDNNGIALWRRITDAVEILQSSESLTIH